MSEYLDVKTCWETGMPVAKFYDDKGKEVTFPMIGGSESGNRYRIQHDDIEKL